MKRVVLIAVVSIVLVLLVIFFTNTLSHPKEVIINVIHAGSLTQPIRAIEEDFVSLYKEKGINITFQDLSAGSVDIIREIAELNEEFDVVLTADSYLIQKYLFPHYVDWYIEFASNSIVLCYTDKSKYANEINAENWFDILLKDGVEYGYANPNADPAGYRTILLFKLSNIYYKKPHLSSELVRLTDKNNIRPKSVELLSLLQSHELDYAFEYESVAVQNNLKYIKLPDEINLANPNLKNLYEKVSITLDDGTVIKGAPIEYGLTIPKNAQNKEYGEKFVAYLLKNGGKVFDHYGQGFVDFKFYPSFESIPSTIRDGIK